MADCPLSEKLVGARAGLRLVISSLAGSESRRPRAGDAGQKNEARNSHFLRAILLASSRFRERGWHPGFSWTRSFLLFVMFRFHGLSFSRPTDRPADRPAFTGGKAIGMETFCGDGLLNQFIRHDFSHGIIQQF